MTGFANGYARDRPHIVTMKLPSSDQEIWNLPEPVNFSAERAVLAAIIYDGFDDERLSPDLFGNTDNRNCFRVIDDLRHVEGTSVNPLSVAAELEKRGQLGTFGGAPALVLMESERETELGFGRQLGELEELAERRSKRAQFRQLFREASLRQYDLADIRDAASRAAQPRDALQFGLIQAGDLLARHLTERPTVIEGILREAEVAGLVSSTKGGKTHTVHGLALHAAVGRPWFGRFHIPPSDVVIVDNELHLETIAFRLRSIAKGLEIPISDFADRLHILSLRGQWLDVGRVLTRVRRLKRRARLVIIDALYRMLPPGISENDNAAITQVFNALDQAAQQLDAAILVVHHSSKGSQSEKAVTDVGSGAGAQSRTVDVHLVMRPHQEENCVVFDARLRSFAPIEPMVLEWQYPLWIPRPDLDPAALRGKTSAAEDQADKDAATDERLLALMHDWSSRTELKRNSKFGDGKINRSLARLRTAGRIEEKRDIRNGNPCDVYRRKDHV